ncbi:hypothetical protein [Microvirga yunnanensis]|uniref:hypothetical protein n=1 Tax=Microvirga yunnanensis TaxID=2953740 RepID=UPI0021C5BF02|nr:hypothetical protein [Microvirga sp. HBU65207]
MTSAVLLVPNLVGRRVWLFHGKDDIVLLPVRETLRRLYDRFGVVGQQLAA